MKYLLTGHTGFKGSWLTAMLKIQGHEVHGIALKPEDKSLFNEAKIKKYLSSSTYSDIRNGKELSQAIKVIQPEVIIHLAAQPLVRASYLDPIGTFETNVIGTLNLLESTKELNSLLATLVITTDKVYKNKNQMKGYVETDELGGHDPYSASKAAADLAVQSWTASFGNTPISIARAGNVIGGGDWGADRLLPEIIYAVNDKKSILLRYPFAIRPWQHVLDCLNGYLKLVDHSITENSSGVFNFGPDPLDFRYVHEVAEYVYKFYDLPHLRWMEQEKDSLLEAETLTLDSSLANKKLKWKALYNFESSIEKTCEWYSAAVKGDASNLIEKQISEFLSSLQ